MKKLWIFICMIALLITADSVRANPPEDTGSLQEAMTLQQAISYALKNNPGIKAERRKLGIGRGQQAQADLPIQYNPQFSGMYLNRTTSDNTRYNDFQFGLSQKFEIAGQPGFRREAARLNLKKIEWQIIDAERLLKAEVKQAFYRMLLTKEKIKLARQVLDFYREVLDISRKRYELGDISRLQVDLNQVGLMRARKERLEIKRKYNSSLYRLKQIINWDFDKALDIEGKIEVASLKFDKDKILKFALDKRPDLSAAKFDLDGRKKQARLAYSKRIPDITFSANYQKDEGADLVGAGVTIPIPFFNRNQGEILRTRSQQEVLGYQLSRLRTEISREVLTAVENFTLAIAEVEIFKQGILPRLSKTLEMVKEAFRLGQIDQLTVTVSQNEFIRTRFSYLEALSEYYRTLVELEKVTASDIGALP